MQIKRAAPDDIWLDQRGRWRPAVRDGERTANLSCPLCGAVASLSQHAIAADGAVSPSVVCPSDICAFHEFVTLTDWSST